MLSIPSGGSFQRGQLRWACLRWPRGGDAFAGNPFITVWVWIGSRVKHNKHKRPRMTMASNATSHSRAEMPLPGPVSPNTSSSPIASSMSLSKALYASISISFGKHRIRTVRIFFFILLPLFSSSWSASSSSSRFEYHRGGQTRRSKSTNRHKLKPNRGWRPPLHDLQIFNTSLHGLQERRCLFTFFPTSDKYELYKNIFFSS